MRAKFFLTLYHIIVVQLHNRKLRVHPMSVSCDSISAQCKLKLHKPWIKKVIQQHMNCGCGLKNKGAGMFCQLAVILTEHALV